MTRGSGRTESAVRCRRRRRPPKGDADAAKAQVRFQPAHGHGLGRLLAVPAFERFVVGAYAASAVAHFVIGGGGRVCPSWLLRCKCWGRLEAGPDNNPRARLAGARTVGNTILRRAVVGYPRRDGCRQGKGRLPVGARGRAAPAAGCEAGGRWRRQERQQAGPGRVALLAWVEWAAAGACGRAGKGFDAARSVSAHRSDQGGAGPRSAGMPTVDVTDRTVLVQERRAEMVRGAGGAGLAQPSR